MCSPAVPYLQCSGFWGFRGLGLRALAKVTITKKGRLIIRPLAGLPKRCVQGHLAVLPTKNFRKGLSVEICSGFPGFGISTPGVKWVGLGFRDI